MTRLFKDKSIARREWLCNLFEFADWPLGPLGSGLWPSQVEWLKKCGTVAHDSFNASLLLPKTSPSPKWALLGPHPPFCPMFPGALGHPWGPGVGAPAYHGPMCLWLGGS